MIFQRFAIAYKDLILETLQFIIYPLSDLNVHSSLYDSSVPTNPAYGSTLNIVNS